MDNFPEFDPENEEMEVEVIEHPQPTTDRSAARRIALQILYELDSTKHPIGQVLDAHVQSRPILTSKIIRYARNLVFGVDEHRILLDELIQKYAPERPLMDLAIIDRNILRLALYEIFARPHLSFNIIIHEAVTLASLFGSESSPRFVNGVLGTIAEDMDQLRERYSHLANSEQSDPDEVD